jgi:hypothetical protein
MNDQRQFADASGDAVLISPGPDGELVFTRKPPGDGYLVSTNYNVINPSHGYGYPCWRYETAERMLGQLIAGSDPLTVEDATSVFDAVHVESGNSWTIATLVADLPNGLIYLYYFYQFDQPVVLSIADELAHPRAPGPFSRLFPEDVQQEAARRYASIQAQADRCSRVGKIWIASVAACLVVLVVLSLGKWRSLLFWAPVVLVLGPLGLLARLIAGPGHRPGRWRAALLEAAGDVTPAAAGYTAYLALALSFPDRFGSTQAQLALILGLPMALGWLVFQGLLLALSAKRGYLAMLWERLPHALVAANLGVAGIAVVTVPLLNLVITRACSLFPSPGWSVGILWAVAVGGALLSGLLLFLYQLWAVKRGLSAWCAAASGRGEVRSGSWRILWWWVLLSYLVLVVGIAAGVILQQLLSA